MTEAVPEITLYNTRTRSKERFTPLDPKNVRMYVCGPTVYDRAHIGNARPVVVFDTLYRLLRHVAPQNGWGKVTYVRNITDVEDKINARAAETGRPIGEITEETIRWYHEDMRALGALDPDLEPRATGYIAEMIAMIETLIAKGHAYVAEGHVLFAVASYPDYGRLARRSLDEMQAGARVEVAPYKRDPMDFVLWKPSDADTPGWESPWGRGRPGWHIECSAMSHALLGPSFDIHGGGIDLVFPHHENEIAQSRCAHPEAEFARVWMHNGFLNVEGEKMSKSLGNFFTVRDLLDQGVSGPTIRLALLLTQYRQPADWNAQRRFESEQTLEYWAKRLARYRESDITDLGRDDVSASVLEALGDDLNSPAAVRAITALAQQARSDKPQIGRSLAASAELLGFRLAGLPAYRRQLEREHAHWVAVGEAIDSAWANTQIQQLLRARDDARKAREFQKADAIRDRLVEAGVELRDSSSGTTFSLGEHFDPARLDEIEP